MTRWKNTSWIFTLRQEHLRGSRKHLKDWLLPPPPRAQGCPSGGRARWSPRGWSSSPCSGPAASFTFSRCQLFHHPLLTKCLLRAIGRSRSENRLKGHVCGTRVGRDCRRRGGGAFRRKIFFPNDGTENRESAPRPPCCPLATTQLLPELGLSRF